MTVGAMATLYGEGSSKDSIRRWPGFYSSPGVAAGQGVGDAPPARLESDWTRWTDAATSLTFSLTVTLTMTLSD